MWAVLKYVVSTHSRLKAAGQGYHVKSQAKKVSTHSRLKAAGDGTPLDIGILTVSTHSRLKAAGHLLICLFSLTKRFNTQPPKGGW